jgi:hypothetical protein
MAWEHSIKGLQFAAAMLGIPAAVGGAYTAYQTFFTNDAACDKLRSSILATMERNVAVDTKSALLHSDIENFSKNCGNSDPDARVIFQAALRKLDAPPAPTVAAALQSTVAGATAAPPTPAPARQAAVIGVFGGAAEHQHGWVALSRRDEKSREWVVNFSGYTISETSLPPAGTVLTAQRPLPVWSEVQIGNNDPSKLESRLPAGACVRVIATRGSGARLWAEIAPASCS